MSRRGGAAGLGDPSIAIACLCAGRALRRLMATRPHPPALPRRPNPSGRRSGYGIRLYDLFAGRSGAC